ncbi:MAG: S8 family serine peptidase [Actinomycetota bacterium]|nr:S8 family serine peptidase [Actinomycetota bacterium]
MHRSNKAEYILLFLLLFLAAGAFGGLPPRVDSARAAVLTEAEQLHIQRLNSSEYPPGTYVPGEVAITLEEPSLEVLAKVAREFSQLIEVGLDELAASFASKPASFISRLRLKPGIDELEASRLLTASPLIKLAEPNVIFSAATTTPDDPLYDRQWNLNSNNGVQADQAWDLQRGSAGLTLAVIDTGMDYLHEDLLGRRVDGYDYYNNDDDPWDDNGHGTLVAGVACANTDNTIGVAGLDWYAGVMPLKALGADGQGTLDDVVNCVYHAAANGADVINMSFTSGTYSQQLQEAVEYAYNKGCVIAAAVGNEGDSRLNYPAGMTYVIGVGSTNASGDHSPSSNTNSSVDLSAPGDVIWGPSPDDKYDCESGTSDSCPHVSGAALLALADNPGATPDEVWRMLRDAAVDKGSPGYDVEYGWGLLDCYSALRVPLVEIASPAEFSYPSSGKVSVQAASKHVDIKYLELWVDGELEDSHTVTPASGDVDYTFMAWDLSEMAEGTHTITVKAIDNSGFLEGERRITVYRNLTQPEPARDWYMAEGTTAWGFEEYVLVQNPNAGGASIEVTFMEPGGSTREFAFSMPGNSRLTITVNSLVPERDVSTHVHSDLPVVAERAMYWDDKTGGHVAVGANAPGTDWYMAEGTTAWGFEEYVLVQNPNAGRASIEVTFMEPGGSTREFAFSMPGYSRLTLDVNSLIPESDVSTHVHSDLPVVAERAMYWEGKEGGHDTLGVTGGCTTWLLAEGTTSWGFEEYVLIQNPNTSDATVTFDFLKPEGERVRRVFTVGPLARFTLNVADVVPGSDVSTYVQADQAVIAERAMYWPRGSRSRAGGHCSTGSVTAATTWYLAEGTTAWGFDEYILLVNPTDRIAHATLVFMRTDGSTKSHSVDVAGGSRVTVFANEVDPDRDASVQVISDWPLVVERAMYWSDKEGGSDALGVLQDA